MGTGNRYRQCPQAAPKTCCPNDFAGWLAVAVVVRVAVACLGLLQDPGSIALGRDGEWSGSNGKPHCPVPSTPVPKCIFSRRQRLPRTVQNSVPSELAGTRETAGSVLRWKRGVCFKRKKVSINTTNRTANIMIFNAIWGLTWPSSIFWLIAFLNAVIQQFLQLVLTHKRRSRRTQ